MTTTTQARAEGTYSKAAEKATKHHSVTIKFEGLGSITLPPVEDLGFLGGLGVLAAAGILEWPLAGILAAGHILSKSSSHSAFRAFGDALEEA
ncbi:hypothetical protein [Sinomonas humi]|uniref:hypothetical protein n=1 Tax=Sinomonas humi TaxID=1338436 RepID=UPI0012E046BF|nr:hypothetical protein [Sinomonas humi]